MEGRISSNISRHLPTAELVVTLIWAVFFFAGSINLAVKSSIWNSGEARASAAFGFLSFFLWMISGYFAFRSSSAGGSLPFARSSPSVSV